MAVPSSGAIRMVGIYSEFNEDDYTSFYPEETPISLTDLSTEGDDTQPQAFTFNKGNLPANKPDKETPHAMSEFYSYDHDATEPSFFDTLSDFTISSTAVAGVAANC